MSEIRKIIYILGFFIASAQAQDAGMEKKARTFYFGAKLGSGITNLHHHHLYTLGGVRLTFSGGGFAEYSLTDWLNINMGVEYTHKGASNLNPRLIYSKKSPILGIQEDGMVLESTNLTIHTIEMPLTGHFILPTASNTTQPFLVFGPSLGYNFFMRADNYYQWIVEDAPNDLMTETSDTKSTGKIAPWVFSIVLGIGTEVKSNAGFHWVFGINYRLGMSNENRFLYSLYQKYHTGSVIGYAAIKF